MKKSNSKGTAKKKQSAAHKKRKKLRKLEYKTVLINGKQVKVKREPLIDGLTHDEFIRQNADPIFLHQNKLWYLMD